MKLKIGDLVPPLSSVTTSGLKVDLGEYLGSPLLLIFLRHLG